MRITNAGGSIERQFDEPGSWRVTSSKSRIGLSRKVKGEKLHDTIRRIFGNDAVKVQRIVELEDIKSSIRRGSNGYDPSSDEQVPDRLFGLTITPANTCDRGCAYCYARPAFNTEEPGRTQYDVLKKTFEFIRRSPAVMRGSCAITIGGAADTLQHMDFYDEAVNLSKAYLEEYGFHVPIYVPTVEPSSITDDRVERILENQDWITLSLDGDPSSAYHRRRVDIAELLSRYSTKGRWASSGVFTRKTAHILSKSYDYLIQSGFEAIHLRPARLPHNHPLALTAESYDIALGQYRDMFVRFRDDWGVALDFFSKITSADTIGQFMDRILIEMDAKERCGAGIVTAYVSAEGDITPCPSVVSPDTHLGNVSSGEYNKALGLELHEHPEACKQCRILSACGGPCIHESMLASGGTASADEDICDFQRKLYDICTEYVLHLMREDAERVSELIQAFVGNTLAFTAATTIED